MLIYAANVILISALSLLSIETAWIKLYFIILFSFVSLVLKKNEIFVVMVTLTVWCIHVFASKCLENTKDGCSFWYYIIIYWVKIPQNVPRKNICVLPFWRTSVEIFLPTNVFSVQFFYFFILFHFFVTPHVSCQSFETKK